jgi:hypothetical protein
MCLNDLLFESFVIVKFFPVGYGLRKLVQLLQATILGEGLKFA